MIVKLTYSVNAIFHIVADHRRERLVDIVVGGTGREIQFAFQIEIEGTKPEAHDGHFRFRDNRSRRILMQRHSSIP